jgi:anti-sigma B factor antagonist
VIELRTKSKLSEDGTYVVSVSGEVDLHSASQLKSELSGLREKNVRSVLVDLTECTFIDSTTLAILVSAKKQLDAAEIQFSLMTTDRNIRKIFEITGLDRILTIHDSSTAAMNGGLHVA